MAFFQDIKENLEKRLIDITTIEHAMIFEDQEGCIYRFQQIDGDSKVYVSDTPLEEDQIKLFNEIFLGASEARTGITRFIIECLT